MPGSVGDPSSPRVYDAIVERLAIRLLDFPFRLAALGCGVSVALASS